MYELENIKVVLRIDVSVPFSIVSASVFFFHHPTVGSESVETSGYMPVTHKCKKMCLEYHTVIVFGRVESAYTWQRDA